jgi:hypothetical protein
MSTSTKRILIVIGGAALFCLVAVAIAAAGLFFLFNRVKSGVASKPAEARKMAQEMIDYQLPDGYSEQLGMDLFVYRMVMIDAHGSLLRPQILLAQFQRRDTDPQEMARQLEQAAQQQISRNGVVLKLVETRTVTIRGQQVPLAVSEGSDKGGIVFRRWLTAFKGKSGSVLVLVQGWVNGWDDVALNAFLASIK